MNKNIISFLSSNKKILLVSAILAATSGTLILVNSLKKTDGFIGGSSYKITKDKNKTQNTENGSLEKTSIIGDKANAMPTDDDDGPYSGTACSLNYTSESCKKLVFGDSPSSPNMGNFSWKFIRLMNQASNRFGIPASVILAYMGGISSLQEYSYYWSVAGEEELTKAVDPWYGTMWGCDELNHMEEGPYDWILNWFIDALEDYGAYEALNEVAEGRGDTASRCNLLDSTYVIASYFGYQNGVVGTQGCNYTDWNSFEEKMRKLTWGENPQGVYLEDQRYEVGGLPYQIFINCKQ